MKKNVSTVVDQQLYELLVQIGEKNNKSLSELIRTVLEMFVKELTGQ